MPFVQTDSQLGALIKKLEKAKITAVDTETTGLSWLKDKIVGMSVAQDTKEGHFFFGEVHCHHGDGVVGVEEGGGHDFVAHG